MICKKCGRSVLDVDESGYCEDCSEDWDDEEMDDFATMVTHSPLNPGL